MQPETTMSKSVSALKLLVKRGFKNQRQVFQFSSQISEDQKIQNKVDLQLYLYFERMYPKICLNYTKDSQFGNKKVSKQKIVNQTIKYLNYLEQSIKPLPPQHYQQLLLLIDSFINEDDLTNRYRIDPDYRHSTSPAKFYLGFYTIKRIDLKQFVSFNNWNHLVTLSFNFCGWFNDDDWRAIVENADNFKNLKELLLSHNKITMIKEEDIEQFKFLKKIELKRNPLSAQTIEVLRRLQQKNNQMIIWFNN